MFAAIVKTEETASSSGLKLHAFKADKKTVSPSPAANLDMLS